MESRAIVKVIKQFAFLRCRLKPFRSECRQ